MSSLSRPQFKIFDLALCVVILLLWSLQAFFSISFKEYLNLEAVAESIRSPYWWSEKTVFNGISSAIGYSSILALGYSVFGYSLYLAKWIRLGIHLISLISLAILLRRWMGAKNAIIPLLVAGLSPTWIFYNYEQAQFGFDLQLFPIILLLACSIPTNKLSSFLFGCLANGALFIWTALVYPTVLFYAPFLLAVLGYRWWIASSKFRYSDYIFALVSWGLGISAVIASYLLYVKDPQILILDPHTKAGILRGGGGGLTRQPQVIFEHYIVVIKDLLVEPSSYGYWITKSEFGSWLGRLGFTGQLLLWALLIWKISPWKDLRRKIRNPSIALFLGLFLLALFNFNFPQLIATFAGMRRITGFLFAYYALLACTWYFILIGKEINFSSLQKRIALIVIFLHLGFHPVTLFSHYQLAINNHTSNTPNWFQVKDTAQASLEFWEQETRKGTPLRCEKFQTPGCRYPEIFGAIQGLRKWSDLSPAAVPAWDPFQKRVRNLDISIWENHEWPHE